MLQFILEPNETYTMPELAQMAIEGGCGWVRFSPGEMPEAEVREVLAELIPLCKETGVFLTIDNHIEMAKEMGLHGVHLRACGKHPLEVREILGPEAIIGVETPSAVSAINLKGKDIDYVTFPVGWDIEKIGEKASACRGAGLEIPIVVDGNFTPGQIPAVLATKVNGIGVGSAISNSPDPVAATEALIAALTK